MDLAAILLACSVHPDDPLLMAVSNVHSHGSPYVVLDVSSVALDEDDFDSTTRAATAAAARAALARIVARGGEPVIGVLPVRPQWASEFGMQPQELFDPCAALQVASAKVSEFDYACRQRGSELSATRRACALELYGASVALPALGRAVLADLTLAPSAIGRLVPSVEALDLAERPSSTGLFFQAPRVAPSAKGNDSPVPLLEVRP